MSVQTALSEPTTSRPHERTISFEWEIARGEDGKRKLAVLSCRHQTAGANMFSGTQHANRYVATLRNETAERSHGFETRSFMVFGDALSILSQETTRFNAKRFEQFAQDALARLRDALVDERVTVFFRP